jgi:membrane-bound serine protease (ClpP class)
MKYFQLFIVIAVILVMISILPTGNSSSKAVVIINFNYAVDPGAQDYFQSSLQFAQSSGDPVIILMNTPGGYLANAYTIVNYIINSEKYVNVTTYVPTGGMAASAGSYIAMASDYIYMANASFIGPSKPYVIGGTASETQHVVNGSIGEMETLAILHHRNVAASVSMVENNTVYNASTAASLGVINGIEGNLSSLMIKLGYQGMQQIQAYESPIQQFESFISDSTVAAFFILIGAVAILLDIYHGSIILSVAGVASLAIGFWGSSLISFYPVSLLFIIMGVVLIFLEIKLGHGLAMVGGVSLVIIGSLIMQEGVSFSSNVSYLNGTSYLIIAFEATVIPIGALYLIGLRKAVMKKPPKVGTERFIGKNGKAVTDITPGKKGVVNVLSEECSAISDEEIKKGDEVTVTEYREGTLVVRKSS